MGEIRLKLGGPRDGIDVRALTSALDQLTKLINSLSDTPGLALPVVDLSMGSNKAAVLVPNEIETRWNSGVDRLRETGTLDPDWDIDTTEAVSDLAALTGTYGVDKVTLTANERTILVDLELAELARNAVAKTPESLGSISGRMYAYSNPAPGKASIRIEPRGGGRKVRVALAPDLTNEASALVERDVEVWGYLRRSPETDQVLSVLALGIELLPSRALPMPAATLRGLWAGDEGDSVEIVRAMRDT